MRTNRASKGATLQDVARRVGVSANTVSAVLNRTNSNTRVSSQTRQAILAAAKDLNYRPNELARSLRRQSSMLLGLFTEFVSLVPESRFLSEITASLQAEAVARGYDLLLHVRREGESPHDLAARLTDGRVDGLIFYPPKDNAFSAAVAERAMPTIGIVDIVPELPSVVVDNTHGGRLQAAHLKDRGYRRVLYRPSSNQPRSAVDRQRGFMDQAESLGLEVIVGRPVGVDEELDFSNEELSLVRSATPGELAIVCWEDTVAYGTMNCLYSFGVGLPEVGLVGFNGLYRSGFGISRLTTIVAPYREMVQTAVHLLFRRIHGEEVPLVTTLPVQLVHGETT